VESTAPDTSRSSSIGTSVGNGCQVRATPPTPKLTHSASSSALLDGAF